MNYIKLGLVAVVLTLIVGMAFLLKVQQDKIQEKDREIGSYRQALETSVAENANLAEQYRFIARAKEYDSRLAAQTQELYVAREEEINRLRKEVRRVVYVRQPECPVVDPAIAAFVQRLRNRSAEGRRSWRDESAAPAEGADKVPATSDR